MKKIFIGIMLINVFLFGEMEDNKEKVEIMDNIVFLSLDENRKLVFDMFDVIYLLRTKDSHIIKLRDNTNDVKIESLEVWNDIEKEFVKNRRKKK